MLKYTLQWPANDIKNAILVGFNYLEHMDHIVGFISARPEIVKKILFAFPEELKMDFILDGVGTLRSAYVLYKSLRWDEIRMVNRDKTIELQIILIDTNI